MKTSTRNQGTARLWKPTATDHKERVFSEISGRMNVITKSEPNLATVLKQSVEEEMGAQSKGNNSRRHSVASRYASPKVESTILHNAPASIERSLSLRRKRLTAGAENDALKTNLKSREANANGRWAKPSVSSFWGSSVCKSSRKLTSSKGSFTRDLKEAPASLKARSIFQNLETPLSWKSNTSVQNASTNPLKKACQNSLNSASYWLEQVKLAEALQKHSISLGFFRLAIECNPKPLQKLRDELLAYQKKYNLYSEAVAQVLFHYDLVDRGKDLSAGKLVQRNDSNNLSSALDSLFCSLRNENSESQPAPVKCSTNQQALASFGRNIQHRSETVEVPQMQSAEPCLEGGESVIKASNTAFSTKEDSNWEVAFPVSSHSMGECVLQPMSSKLSKSIATKEQVKIPIDSQPCEPCVAKPDAKQQRVPMHLFPFQAHYIEKDAPFEMESCFSAGAHPMQGHFTDENKYEDLFNLTSSPPVCPAASCGLDQTSLGPALAGRNIYTVKTINVDSMLNEVVSCIMSSMDDSNQDARIEGSKIQSENGSPSTMGHSNASSYDTAISIHKQFDFNRKAECAAVAKQDLVAVSSEEKYIHSENLVTEQEAACDASEPSLDIWNTSPSKENMDFSEDMDVQDDEAQSSDRHFVLDCNSELQIQNGRACSDNFLTIQKSGDAKVNGQGGIKDSGKEAGAKVNDGCEAYLNDAALRSQKRDLFEGNLCNNRDVISIKKKGEMVNSESFSTEPGADKKGENEPVTHETPVRDQVQCPIPKTPSSRSKSRTRLLKTSLTTPIVNSQRASLSNCPLKVSPSNRSRNPGSSARRNAQQGMSEDRSVKQVFVEPSCLTPDARTESVSQSVGTPGSTGLRRSARIQALSPAATLRT